MQLTKKDILRELAIRKEIAINKAMAAREAFPSNKYEWEIGVEVYKIITSEITQLYLDDSFRKFTLFGYPARINCEDPTIIKLWKEVN